MNDLNKNPKNSRKNLNRVLSSFLTKDNHSLIGKHNHGNVFANISPMINIYQLNNILYDLKHKYNQLLVCNHKKSKKIEQILIILKDEKERLYTIVEKKNKIECSKEDLIIPNFKSINVTKEEMAKNIFKLIEQKNSIDNLFKVQEDYQQILEYLMESEKNNSFLQKKEFVKILEKTRVIKRCQKIIDNYIMKTMKGEKDYILLKNKIGKNIKFVLKINDVQMLTIDKLNNVIKEKEFEISSLKDKIKELKRNISQEINLPKKELEEKIQKAKDFKKNELKTEKKYIEIINCLSFLQKQIYEYNDMNNVKKKNIEISDNQFFDKSNKEEKNNLKLYHKTQMSSIYSFNKNNKSIFDSFSVINNKKINSLFKNKRKYNEMKNIKKKLIKTQSTLYQTLNNLSSINDTKNNLSILVNKLNDIKITKNEIFEYVNKIMTKSEFYRAQMNLLHDKEINLENLKNSYTTKAKNIISNNIFKFDELTKNNEKCKEFLEKNELFFNGIKNTKQKLAKNKILEHIKNNSKIDNNKKQDSINEESITNNINLFQKSKNLIRIIRTFFLICFDLLKDIHIAISKDENYSIDEIKKDINDKPYIEVIKKLNEFFENEEVIISKDYKLILQYIKNLLKFCKQNGDVLPKDVLEEINSNLFKKFYLPGELNKKLDNNFINFFLAKKNKNYNDIFIYFTALVEPAVDIIVSLYNLINSNENIKLLKDNNIGKESQRVDKKYNKIASKMKRNKKYNLFDYKSKSVNNININDELCKDEDDEVFEKNANINRISRNKMNKLRVKLINKQISDKLYEPYMAKTLFMKNSNLKIPNIKLLSDGFKANNQIMKKIRGINMFSRKMNLLENSDVYTNKLINITYNSLIKLMKNND